MLNRATLIAIVIGAVVYWALEGIWMGLVMADYYKAQYSAFESLTRPEADQNVALWLITTFLASSLLMWVARMGTVSVANAAKVGLVIFATYSFMMEFGMYMWFKDVVLFPSIAISTVWEGVAGAITGACAGFVYTKLNKS